MLKNAEGGMLFEPGETSTLIRLVWAEALRWGASVLPENITKEEWDKRGFYIGCCGEETDGYEQACKDSRSILLEEAAKVMKDV